MKKGTLTKKFYSLDKNGIIPEFYMRKVLKNQNRKFNSFEIFYNEEDELIYRAFSGNKEIDPKNCYLIEMILNDTNVTINGVEDKELTSGHINHLVEYFKNLSESDIDNLLM